MLTVTNLRRTFRTPDGQSHTVIDVPTFELGQGAQVALSGSSGSGKTTFLHLLSGVLRADAGTIRIGDTELTSLSEAGRDALRATAIGYVFQTFNLLQGFSILENLELAMSFGRGWDDKTARGLLERVGLADRLHYRPAQLSVGQQQRVAVARALANHPQLVLADEPTGNLDPTNAAESLKLLQELCRENDAALLLVSHDPGVLGAFEDARDFSEINQAAHGVTA